MNPYSRYLSHFTSERSGLVVALFLAAIAGVLPGAFVLALAQLLEALRADVGVSYWMLTTLVVAGLQGAFVVTRSFVTRRIAARVVHRVRCRVHERLFHVEVGAGERIAMLTGQADALQYGVSAIITAIRNPISVLGLAVAAWSLSPGLTLRSLVLLPIVAVVAAGSAALVRRTTRAWVDADRGFVSELHDQHAGLSTAVDLGGEGVQVQRLAGLSHAEAYARAQRDWVRAVPSAATQFAVVASAILLLRAGLVAVRAGELTPGALVGFGAALVLLQRPLAGLAEVWSLMERAVTATERLERVLETPPPPRLSGPLVARSPRVKGVVRIADGEKVALVGPSGAGKTSMLAALAVFEGCVRVRQDPWVFNRTVEDNLRLAAPDAPREALCDILQRVGLDVALTRGMGSGMGERGRAFSGGERQRLCLARALLVDGRALLLDEVTSELDTVTAEPLVELLASLPQTVVFASHDPAFAQRADRVIWLDAGAIRGEGTHRELLEQSAYKALWS